MCRSVLANILLPLQIVSYGRVPTGQQLVGTGGHRSCR